VGLYRDHVLPRLTDRCCGLVPAEHRARACAGLSGEVVEVGFGSGLNVPHYPAGVTRVLAVEPSDVGFRRAADRLAASPVRVERVAHDAQRLPLPDASVDAALSTWTMCTIPDVAAALAELRRVLRPGGRLHFVEHGLSPDGRVARWQHRLNGLQMRLAGGCRIDRPIGALVEQAGFRLERLETGYVASTPNPWGYLYEGTATAP
jgi:ubiquinone/menaquinone biosynthesis C-methylase UbiE